MKLWICFWRPLDPTPKRDSDTTDKSVSRMLSGRQLRVIENSKLDF
jgi:hypothetical protein